MSNYSLRKSKQILKNIYVQFRRKKRKLPQNTLEIMQRALLELQEAILAKDIAKSSEAAHKAESLAKTHLKKTVLCRIRDHIFSLTGALAVAICIRLTCFEPYEIPSGSMRPTFKEKDKLIVSKTQFGLNIPLVTSHFVFYPDAVKRMGIVTFTGENLDISNVRTMYFYLFPGYKQFIKRMIGLPGDSLYFYGGKIYGVDKNGNDISSDLQREELSYLEHIPFLYLEGRERYPKAPLQGMFSPIIIKQANTALAKLSISQRDHVDYEILPSADSQKKPPKDLHEFWGMHNFAQVRMLQKSLVPLSEQKTDAAYYLELTHHASAKKGEIYQDQYYCLRPKLHKEISYIPLSEDYMKKIWDEMYTGRLVIEKGLMHGYGDRTTATSPKINDFSTSFVTDGTYEWLDGVAYKVGMQGLTTKLSADHPLVQYSPKMCYLLFNAGINCDERFVPHKKYEGFSFPTGRYGYFKEGNLTLLGKTIFSQYDPVLQEFVQTELAKQQRFTSYIPFVDHGPPLREDGSLDVELVQNHGLHVPDRHYFVLGDNHAMSSDSREFGFVPQENLRGVPGFTFWAPEGRYNLGQSLYPFQTPARIFVWIVLAIFFSSWLIYNKIRYRVPLHQSLFRFFTDVC